MYQKTSKGVDGFTVAALALLLFIGLSLIVDSGEGFSPNDNSTPSSQPTKGAVGGQVPNIIPTIQIVQSLGLYDDQTILNAPYDNYIITQGLHGFNYGHAAIDISGGKGSTIISPINGIISERYIDDQDNTTLIIENDKFKVTFLHGNYIVNVGDKVIVGQTIGSEGNNGYTTDMLGRLCTNRDCGYHSHLNVFDKELGRNIDPLSYFD